MEGTLQDKGYDVDGMVKHMCDLHVTLISMTEDELEIFKTNNKVFVENLVLVLTN